MVKKLNRDDLLQKARDLAARHGDGLTLYKFRREAGVSAAAIYAHFESWTEVRGLVGINPVATRPRSRPGEADILQLAKDLALRYGEKLTLQIFARETRLTKSLITDRFGTWSALRQQAGLKSRAARGRLYTEAQMLEDMYRVWRPWGTLPRVCQHRRHGGKICAKTIRDFFGGWAVAIAAYNAYCRNREETFDPFGRRTPLNGARPTRLEGQHLELADGDKPMSGSNGAPECADEGHAPPTDAATTRSLLAMDAALLRRERGERE